MAVAQGEAAAKEASPAAEPQPSFNVWEYRILGNTTLPGVGIERAVYSFLGRGKTLADVESARQSLETAYRNAGYGTVFVDVPEQQVDKGIVRLKITEGRLDRVRISGARYFSNGGIRAALPALSGDTIPKLPEVQAQLTALNRVTPDRSVVPVLKAGREPGTVDVELKVSDTLPVHGSIEVNDRYTADTSKLRVNAVLSYDNLFQRQHKFSLQYQTSPQEPGDVRAMVASYAFRIPALPNTMLALYAVDSKSDVAALGTLSVIGNGQIFGARAIHGLKERPNYFHNISFGLDYKDFLEDIRLADTPGLVTPIRYLNWSLAYTGTLNSTHTTSTFNLGANFGVRGVVNETEEFEEKRFKGAPNYVYLRGGVEHLRQLPWQLQVFARLTGQIAQSPLVSNEQLAIGGADTVRGYLESNQLGDYGFYGNLELRNIWLSKLLQVRPGAAYVFAFYDAGLTAILDPLPAQTARVDLSSWGAGIRAGGWHGLSFSLDWARVFVPVGSVLPNDDRTHFRFEYAF